MGLNHYSELLMYIKSLADASPFINTTTNSEPDKIDWNKANLFPLLNVSITGGSFTNGRTVKFEVELVCLDKRIINKDISTDKYYGNDNEIDNMNKTLSILNTLWTYMYKDFGDRDIVASEDPSLSPLFEERTNLLDGWKLLFEVEMPNDRLNLCT